MKSKVAVLVFALHVLSCAAMPTEIVLWTQNTVRGTVTTTGSEISYSGDIDAVVAKTIVDLIEHQKYDTLRIQSPGGDVVAARSIGMALFDHQMTLVVRRQCSSSCARYIFTAAKKKHIESDAYVMFSEYQKYRDFVETVARLSKQKELGEDALGDEEKRTLAGGEKWVDLDRSYFTKIGVDMNITSAGYIPGRPVSYWLLTGKRMAEYGVRNITAPDDYGSQEYCDKIKKSSFVNVGVQCL